MLLPTHRPPHTPGEIRQALSLVRMHGAQTRAFFERKVREYLGTERFVATGSGRRALYFGMRLLGIGQGDQVIYPAYTPAIVPLIIRATGAEAVPCDVTPQDWTLDPGLVSGLITDRTRAVLPVHQYGCPPDLGKLGEICRKNDLFLVENAAPAFGAWCSGKPAGMTGDVGIFSFGLGKSLSLGGGGGLVVRDPALFPRAARDLAPVGSRSSLSLLATLFASRGLSHPALYHTAGFRLKRFRVAREYRNYTRDLADARDLAPLAYGLGACGLARRCFEERVRNAAYYRALLRDSPGIRPQSEREGSASISTRFFVVTRSPAAREAICQALVHEGIEPGPPEDLWFLPAAAGAREEDFPVSRQLAETLVGIPVYTRIPVETIRRVFSAP